MLTGQVEVVAVEVEVLLDLVEVVVVVGAGMAVQVVVVGLVVVWRHGKKILMILMIADFPCAAFSAALIVFLAGAFSWSVLAVCHHLENHCRLLVPTSFQIAGYPGVC